MYIPVYILNIYSNDEIFINLYQYIVCIKFLYNIAIESIHFIIINPLIS
jgi:hypothetical protein